MAERVTIVSPMRDGAAGLPSFRARFEALDYPPAALRLVVVEGDSVDGTFVALLKWAAAEPRLTVIKSTTGLPRFGSVIDPVRFRALAQVFNAGLEAVDLTWSTHALFIPSDVAYEPDLVSRLLAHDKDLVAPFFWMPSGHRFYDTWGFIRDGQHFGNFPRSELAAYGDKPIQMDTVGGVILMRAEVLRAGARYTPEEVDQGLCKTACDLGFTVWADPTTHVTHL